MSPVEASAVAASKLVIRNAGLVLSGNLDQPILDADTIVVVNGVIAAVGRSGSLDLTGATQTIDAKGCAVTPGLIDNHVHPVSGDWTPRQNQLGWIESTLHGGRHHDRVGRRGAHAGAAARSRGPQGPGDCGAAHLLELPAERHEDRGRRADPRTRPDRDRFPRTRRGRRDADRRSWPRRRQGRTDRAADDRLGATLRYDVDDAYRAARPLPVRGGSGAETVLEVDADVVAHVNGGPTALPDAEIRRICKEGTRALEIVHNGNLRTGLMVLALAKARGELRRIILGTDGPAGSGVQPLGILRTITMLASLGDVPPEVAFCFATGNTAGVRGFTDRGLIAPGRAADLVFMDQAIGGAGDGLLDSIAHGNLPGIGMIMVDGEVRTGRSRNTPPAERVPEVST